MVRDHHSVSSENIKPGMCWTSQTAIRFCRPTHPPSSCTLTQSLNFIPSSWQHPPLAFPLFPLHPMPKLLALRLWEEATASPIWDFFSGHLLDPMALEEFEGGGPYAELRQHLCHSLSTPHPQGPIPMGPCSLLVAPLPTPRLVAQSSPYPVWNSHNLLSAARRIRSTLVSALVRDISLNFKRS